MVETCAGGASCGVLRSIRVRRERNRARWRDEKSNAERRDVCLHNARVVLKTMISSRMSQKTHLHVVVLDDSHECVVLFCAFSFLAHAKRSAESVERMKNFRSRASLFPHGTALSLSRTSMSGTKEESDDKFLIWPQLKGDKHFVRSLPLSDVYLNNDSTWPWVVLVPRKNDMVEYHELSNEEQMQLMREMTLISRVLWKGWPEIAKLNTGMIGCVCRQLHCHILGRFENDKCWPNPVWGASEAVKYSEEEAKETKEKLERLIKEEEEEKLLLLKSSTN